MKKANWITSIVVHDIEGDSVELSVYKHKNGGIFALDSSFVEQELEGDEINATCVDPFSSIYSPGLVKLIE